MNAIVCRSPEQIADDELFDALEMCNQALRCFTIGSGYLYVGQRRERITALRDKLLNIIASGDNTGWTNSINPTWVAYHTIHR